MIKMKKEIAEGFQVQICRAKFLLDSVHTRTSSQTGKYLGKVIEDYVAAKQVQPPCKLPGEQ